MNTKIFQNLFLDYKISSKNFNNYIEDNNYFNMVKYLKEKNLKHKNRIYLRNFPNIIIENYNNHFY